MKTFFTKSALYLALTIPAFFFLGCDDSEEGGSYEFSVEPTVLTFSAKQETQTLSVRTYGDWSIVLPQDAAWLKVSAMSGRGLAEIEVTAENYYRTDTSRTARLTVTGGNSGDFHVEVVQRKLQMNDLSAAGKANCYIVPTSGDFVINAATQGNSESEQVGEWTSAELLWEDNRELITDLYGDPESKRIFFSTAAAGNAVIAVKDASGKILWSWHIWATDFDPNAKTLKYTNDNGSTWEFMDRNLGAANAESGSFGAFGLLYQWGRKDPFTAATAFAPENPSETIRWNMLNNPLPAMASDADSMGTVQLSIEHPTSFYVTRYAHGDWNGQPDPNLWGAVSGQKTVYDPCPAGWRVPAYDAQGDSPYAFVTRQTTTGTDNIGRIYTDGNGNDFLFPVAGSRVNGTGTLDCPGNYGSLWTATGKTTSNEDGTIEYGCLLFFTTGRLVSATYYDTRSQGVSVRCVKE